jgi:hypothetical protein
MRLIPERYNLIYAAIAISISIALNIYLRYDLQAQHNLNTRKAVYLKKQGGHPCQQQKR